MGEDAAILGGWVTKEGPLRFRYQQEPVHAQQQQQSKTTTTMIVLMIVVMEKPMSMVTVLQTSSL
jgi:hypothetical protein